MTNRKNIQHYLTHKKNPQGRPLKINNEDTLTLALYQHVSTRITKKSLYEDFKETLNCSYKTLVLAINKVSVYAMNILTVMIQLGKQYGHLIKYTDATDISVCFKKNADKHKTMRAFAEIARSLKG